MPVDEDTNRWEQFGELRSDVRHIQSDVSDVKVELRAVTGRIDALRDKMDQNAVDQIKRIDALRDKMDQNAVHQIKRIDALRDKMDQNAVDQIKRTDALHDKIDQNAVDQIKRIDDLREVMGARFEAADAKTDSVHRDLTGKIESVRIELTGKIESVRTELSDRIGTVDAKVDSVSESLSSAKVWAVLLYVALAGTLLTVLARGFKWI